MALKQPNSIIILSVLNTNLKIQCNNAKFYNNNITDYNIIIQLSKGGNV